MEGAIALHGLTFRLPMRSCALALAAILSLTAFGGDVRANQPRVEEQTAERDIGEPIMAIVSIATQHITVYDAVGWIHRAPISSGTRGRETPAGIFAIVQKNADHRSNLYDDAEMPHMQRLTWNGIALHGGPLPGYAASHGCVRMPYGFAERLFDQTQIGMRVIVSPTDTAPVAFAHPALLMPKTEAIAAALANAEALELAAADAARIDSEAMRTAAAANRQAALVKSSLRKLEWLKTRVDAELAQATKSFDTAKPDQNRVRAEEAKLKADARAAELATQLETARADLKAKLETAAEAMAVVKDTAARKAETAKAAKEAKLALEPVSVYISRATQKVYVRRNTRKPWADGGEVFDASIEAPITIRDPDQPIGTHIFTATSLGDKGLRWTAVTIDGGDEAKNALDRVAIPREVLDRIASTALPRSSIIVSDEPLSRETNYRTEFVVVLSNQPQGGFITRKPTVAAPSDGAYGWGGGFGVFDQRGFDRRSGDRRRRDGYGWGQRGWW